MKGILTGLMVGWMASVVAAAEVAALPVKPVELKLAGASWFVGTPATALVAFPETVEEAEEPASGGDGVTLISVAIDDSKEGSVAVVTWLPEKDGPVVFPALEFRSETVSYQSPAMQLLVSAPQRSTEMALAITPAKQRVFAGEPLRLDIRWTCRVPTKRLRSMDCHPSFFGDPGIEVVVPRSTAPEAEQLGLPFGGRRVIAHLVDPDEGDGLGVVKFPVFLRISEPGTYTLPAVRLECARLKKEGAAFAPYAAYFNNGLFEPVSETDAYDRVFVESEPFEIKVLPLPEVGRLESFSGLFTPCGIEVSAKPKEGEVGQVIEVDILVRSDAPHGFLDLPDLRKQRALRSWFKVDPEFGRIWHPEGTVFRARVRPLTTAVNAFPSLEFEVFDPVKGEYALISTDPVPLRILSRDGRDYFDSKTLGDDQPSLTDQPAGIWQNAEINTMDGILNAVGNFLANGFWLLLAAGPALFALLLPWVNYRRRCATSPGYQARHQAYRAFQKLPEGSAGKWNAFRKLIAISLGVEPSAWTSGDARDRLKELGVAEGDIAMVVKCQESLDAETFSHAASDARIPELDGLAKRIGKALGKSAWVVLAMMLTDSLLGASEDWNRAMRTFDLALEADSGSDEAVALFTESALNFEASAGDGGYQGKAWLNAGNAWFQAGEIGRSIASYRQAEVDRPFDPSVRDNLAAARALAVDVVEDKRSPWWLRLPFRWIAAAIIPVSLGFWFACLGYVRFRKRPWIIASGMLFTGLLALGTLGVAARRASGGEGVMVVPEVFGRKGSSYRYQTAFHEAFHDGLELKVVESRDAWLKVELADGRRAWVPESSVQRVFR